MFCCFVVDFAPCLVQHRSFGAHSKSNVSTTSAGLPQKHRRCRRRCHWHCHYDCRRSSAQKVFSAKCRTAVAHNGPTCRSTCGPACRGSQFRVDIYLCGRNSQLKWGVRTGTPNCVDAQIAFATGCHRAFGGNAVDRKGGGCTTSSGQAPTILQYR